MTVILVTDGLSKKAPTPFLQEFEKETTENHIKYLKELIFAQNSKLPSLK